MSDLLSSQDAWPDHPRSEPRRALDEARRSGWWFRKTTNHAFGAIYCRPPADGHDHCKLIVFSTSGGDRDGHRTATLIRDVVRRCPHRVDQPADEQELIASADVEGALRNAGHLVHAGFRLLLGEMADRTAERLLEESENDADPAVADELLAQALDAHSEAETARSESVTYASRANEVEPWPRPNGARDLAQDSQRWLEQAELALTQLPADDRQATRDEYARVKKGLDSLKVAIENADQ